MSKQPATAATPEPYTTVIGLEVHVQLQTHTKLPLASGYLARCR
jgi:hypothetical protein